MWRVALDYLDASASCSPLGQSAALHPSSHAPILPSKLLASRICFGNLSSPKLLQNVSSSPWQQSDELRYPNADCVVIASIVLYSRAWRASPGQQSFRRLCHQRSTIHTKFCGIEEYWKQTVVVVSMLQILIVSSVDPVSTNKPVLSM